METSHEVNIPRPLTDAVPTIHTLVELYRESSNLEPSILSMGLSNVNEPTFDSTYNMLVQYTHWDTPPTLSHNHIYTYMSEGGEVCTDVNITSSVSISHTKVHTTRTVDMHIRNHGDASATCTVYTKVDDHKLPETVYPTSVKLRTQYTFMKAPWMFVISRTWAGTSRTEAELAQSKGDTIYGIDVYFQPGDEYWYTPKHTSTYVATSMLMKLVDLVSSEMVMVQVTS